MTIATAPNHQKILVVDDNPSIHEDIRKILVPREEHDPAMADTLQELFGDDPTEDTVDHFVIDSAYQGEEGLRMVQAARAEGQPYSLAFVDVRMPPGWDGVETITRIWEEHPDLQVVICTAYSDYSWEDMVRQIGRSSSMVVLKKPFDNIEVLQLAHALTEKWKLNRQVEAQISDLDQKVDQRTADLQAANEQLKLEIAERLNAQKALVLSEERFSKAFNANPIPLAILSLENENFIDANTGFQSLTGFSLNELTGHKPSELNLWDDPEQVHDILKKLRSKQSVRHCLCHMRTQSGEVRDILLSVELIELAGETSLLAIAMDITDQLLMEKQLRHSQKMDAVGQLAAGIAHDFNNLLTVIQGNASLIMMERKDSTERPLLDGILTASQRSARLVRQLLTFSHKQKLESQQLSVELMLAPMTEMLPRMLGEHIKMSFTVAEQLPSVLVDTGMMEQLLMNLAVNARDSMPEGGKLDIAATSAELSEEDARGAPHKKPGRFLRLSVSDTGAGIPPEVLPRIFEPFFTTKPVGKGTGLGLATVYGIARQHDGWIEVSSRIGHGTSFQVYIPFSEENAAKESELPPQADVVPPGGHETILLVEDDETVRQCVKTILEMHDYTIITANTGVDALEIWADQKAHIDLVLTDMVMPDGITGHELATRLLEEQPDLKLIFSSGYSPDLISDKSSLLMRHRFISKPYHSNTLLQVVRETLDA